MNEHLCLIVGLHSPVCSQYHSWGSGPFHCVHLFWGWLFSHRVHWRSWFDYEFALLWSCRSKCRPCLTFNRCTECSFVRILELVNIFDKSHAVLRTHLSCCQVSSCDLSPNFGAQGLRSWGAHFGMIPPHGLIREFWFGARCPWRLWRCALLPIFLDHVE